MYKIYVAIVIVFVEATSVLFPLISIFKLKRTMPDFFRDSSNNNPAQTPVRFYVINPSLEPRERFSFGDEVEESEQREDINHEVETTKPIQHSMSKNRTFQSCSYANKVSSSLSVIEV